MATSRHRRNVPRPTPASSTSGSGAGWVSTAVSRTTWLVLGGFPMNAGLMAVLTENERLLVAETEPSELSRLDEDATVALETRIRRARNKYTGQYRRTAAGRVGEKGGRGIARPQNQQAAMKAEAFEEALARVSRRVSVLSRQAAR